MINYFIQLMRHPNPQSGSRQPTEISRFNSQDNAPTEVELFLLLVSHDADYAVVTYEVVLNKMVI